MGLTSNPSSTVVPKSFHKLRDVNTFILDDGTSLPRARHRFEMTCFPNLCMKFINMISHSHLTWAPFVLRAFFPAAQVFLVPSGFTPVRHNLIGVTPFVDALFGLSPFGIQVANLPLVSRRPLYSRFCHAACLLCGQLETSEHLIILCPRKTAFWSSIWNLYFENSFDLYRLTQALLYLSFSRLKLKFDFKPEIVFSSSLLALWRAHWRLVFDVVPFDATSTITQVNRFVNKYTQESLLDRGESPLPLPHVNFS
ncbi:hypothetical protein G6F56_001703 [Rhizopus delemar]|nr:hypothetical protein G6F56_001703 [Rhizopus delemar]